MPFHTKRKPSDARAHTQTSVDFRTHFFAFRLLSLVQT